MLPRKRERTASKDFIYRLYKIVLIFPFIIIYYTKHLKYSHGSIKTSQKNFHERNSIHRNEWDLSH